ncbi:uncharacterized protein FA14DRAFT_160230 [Meira miltonrushii]|uniref:Uncharacterized protein n=1 Tax=Meira miltonrushii TaxID=1280837 RepID=A0A316VB63_9BASI|nr:uncharacterized protein FA14DRAFT_160230 [Meira miltonrushii]PWN34772.1 hypothetical protein FA14DRAFT_160230 [Meira miltonrushii]
MRSKRTRKAPVAADGSLLVAPKRRRYSARASTDLDSNRQSVLSDEDLSSAEEEDLEHTPKGKRAKAAQQNGDDELDIEAQAGPSNASRRPSSPIFDEPELEIAPLPARNRQTKKAALAPIKVNSPLQELPSQVKEKCFTKARAYMLSVLSGQLPPAGKDERGKFDGSECIGLEEQWRTLHSTIGGTIKGEGNSALLVGTPGTGKHMLLESVLRSFKSKQKERSFHVVHLDAAMQPTDRLSLRELARQLIQAGAIRLPKEGEDGGLDLDLEGDDGLEEEEEELEENFGAVGPVDGANGTEATEDEEAAALQNAILSSLANTTSTILTLLSSEQAKSKSSLPLVIVLSSFDLYTTRPRQALLYVLLDAVQAGSYTPGLCVIGATSRLDTTDLLEKRVRSRFSGRIINVWANEKWPTVMQRTLTLGQVSVQSKEAMQFNKAVQDELQLIGKDAEVNQLLSAWESMGNDIRSLYRVLYPIVASTSTAQPSLYAALLEEVRKAKAPRQTMLDELTTPEFALLIAAKQLLSKDCEIFNFAMCFEEVQQFVSRVERDRIGAGTAVVDIRRYESDQASPSRRQGMGSGSLSVQWCGLSDRKRVMMAFRTLLSLELFQPESILNSLSLTASTTTAAAASAAKKAAQTAKTDFMRVKCTLFPQTIVEAAKSKTRVEPLGIHLVQWANSQS